jgi:hypothetical protein
MGKLGMRGSFAHEKRDQISRKKEESAERLGQARGLQKGNKVIKVDMKKGFTGETEPRCVTNPAVANQNSLLEPRISVWDNPP